MWFVSGELSRVIPGVVDHTTGLPTGNCVARQNWMVVFTAGAPLFGWFAKSRFSA